MVNTITGNIAGMVLNTVAVMDIQKVNYLSGKAA